MRRLTLLRGAAADPRVLSIEHHRHQCLSAADPLALHRRARPAPRAYQRRHPAKVHHAVERRDGDLCCRGAPRGHHRIVGTGGRRHRGRARRPHDRACEHYHLRYGRNVMRRGASQGRRAIAVESRPDCRARSRLTHAGHQYGERRRRHDRDGRSLRYVASRTSERRRRAGAGLLRARRRDADHHRLQSGAGLSRRGRLPRRANAPPGVQSAGGNHVQGRASPGA